MTGVLAWHTITSPRRRPGLGLPIGIAAGHWAWAAFAASLGVVPVTVVPLLGLVLGLIALLAAGTALTAVPAAIAARVPTALALRNE